LKNLFLNLKNTEVFLLKAIAIIDFKECRTQVLVNRWNIVSSQKVRVEDTFATKAQRLISND